MKRKTGTRKQNRRRTKLGSPIPNMSNGSACEFRVNLNLNQLSALHLDDFCLWYLCSAWRVSFNKTAATHYSIHLEDKVACAGHHQREA